MQLCRARVFFSAGGQSAFTGVSKGKMCCVTPSSPTARSRISLYAESPKLSRKAAGFQRRHLVCLFIRNYVLGTFQLHWALRLLQVPSCQRSQLNVQCNFSPTHHLRGRTPHASRGSLTNTLKITLAFAGRVAFWQNIEGQLMKKRQLFSCGLGVRHLWITAVSAVNTLGLCCRITQGKEPGQAPMSSLKIDTMVSGDRRVAAAPCSVLTLPGLVLFPLPTDTEKPFFLKKTPLRKDGPPFLFWQWNINHWGWILREL